MNLNKKLKRSSSKNISKQTEEKPKAISPITIKKRQSKPRPWICFTNMKENVLYWDPRQKQFYRRVGKNLQYKEDLQIKDWKNQVFGYDYLSTFRVKRF